MHKVDKLGLTGVRARIILRVLAPIHDALVTRPRSCNLTNYLVLLVRGQRVAGMGGRRIEEGSINTCQKNPLNP